MRRRPDTVRATVLRSAERRWAPSPQAGVVRLGLERDHERLSRSATSIVRFAPGRGFPRHLHHVGEEIFVLGGVFSDESGNFGPGTYLRNPAGSSHGPFSVEGCLIFIKLLPGYGVGRSVIALTPATQIWTTTAEGLSQTALHADEVETVALHRLAPGATLPERAHPDGEELLVIEGAVESDRFGPLGPLDWVRNPGPQGAPIRSRDGAVLWVKRGHLGGTPIRRAPVLSPDSQP